LAAGLYLVWRERGQLRPFVTAAVPVLAVLLLYNFVYLGSPFELGQLAAAEELARQKTGSSRIWQTPLQVGLAGLLFSPSRGLLVYSPVVLFSLWGLVRGVRKTEWRPLMLPLGVAMLAVWVLSGLHYDWWGGWSYGYRHIVDTMPVLALGLLPVLDRILANRALLGVFGVLFCWSAMVQAVGALAYDVDGWNARQVYSVQMEAEPEPRRVESASERDRLLLSGGRVVDTVALDVDQPEHRSRLWSWGDWQIGYYLREFTEARRRRRAGVQRWIERY
jgi:hypothetical protein